MSQQVERLFKKARAGKAVLFLGAGASVGSGAPGGEELTRLICDEFLDSTSIPGDFIEACTRVLDTDGVDRVDLEDFIRKQLDLTPSPYHALLSGNRWQAIFTT